MRPYPNEELHKSVDQLACHDKTAFVLTETKQLFLVDEKGGVSNMTETVMGALASDLDKLQVTHMALNQFQLFIAVTVQQSAKKVDAKIITWSLNGKWAPIDISTLNLAVRDMVLGSK